MLLPDIPHGNLYAVLRGDVSAEHPLHEEDAERAVQDGAVTHVRHGGFRAVEKVVYREPQVD